MKPTLCRFIAYLTPGLPRPTQSCITRYFQAEAVLLRKQEPRAASDTARGPGFPRSRENGDASAASRSAFLARSLGRPFGPGFRLALGGAFGLVVAFARLEIGRASCRAGECQYV